jgi:hypothetical protein
MAEPLETAMSDRKISQLPQMANRHDLVSGVLAGLYVHLTMLRNGSALPGLPAEDGSLSRGGA